MCAPFRKEDYVRAVRGNLCSTFVRRMGKERVLIAPISVHHPDAACLSAAMRAEHDVPSIRRPSWMRIESDRVREARNARAIGIHHVDFTVAIAIGVERDAAPVWRPAWMTGEFRGAGGSRIRQAMLARPIRTNDVKIPDTVPIGIEDDRPTVGRP